MSGLGLKVSDRHNLTTAWRNFLWLVLSFGLLWRQRFRFFFASFSIASIHSSGACIGGHSGPDCCRIPAAAERCAHWKQGEGGN